MGIAILIHLGELTFNLILTLLIYSHGIPSTYAFSFSQWSCYFHFPLLFLCSMFAHVWAHLCSGMHAWALEVDVWAHMCIVMHAWELDVWAHMCIVMYAWDLEVDVWTYMYIGMHAWELEVDVRNQF